MNQDIKERLFDRPLTRLSGVPGEVSTIVRELQSNTHEKTRSVTPIKSFVPPWKILLITTTGLLQWIVSNQKRRANE